MSSKKEVIKLLKSRKSSHSLPRDFYNNDEIFKMDMKKIWYQSWIFVGHPVELLSKGDFFTLTVGKYPIVVIRIAKDGAIKAFHHDEKKFNTEYGHVVDPKKSIINLKEIACEEAADFIYISLAQNPDSIQPIRDDIHDYVKPHNLNQLKLVSHSTIIEKGNWKLVLENNRECYHCASNHPELIITFPEDPSVTGVPGDNPPKELSEHWQRCESQNLPSRYFLSEDGTYRVNRVPLLNDFTSFTMDGKDAVSKKICHVDDPRIGTLLYFHYPSTWCHLLGDQVCTFRILPLTSTTTQLTTKWLVHKDAVEGVDYTLDNLKYVWEQTNLEDRHLVEQNQLGINSPDYQSGPYSSLYESGVIQFVDWYSDTLKKRLLKPKKAS